MSRRYKTKPGEEIQQSLYSFDRTETFVLVEDIGNNSYALSFFPKPQPIPRSGLAKRLFPLTDSMKITASRDERVGAWLNGRTMGKLDLGNAVGMSLYGESPTLKGAIREAEN
jgi:hypothetical protein